MARKTTAEKLAEVNAEMNELKNEKKQLLQKHKVEECKARTKRLIDRGAILESMIDGAAELTNDQIAIILQRTVGSSVGVKIVAEMKSQGSDVSASESEETDEDGGNISAHGAEIENEGV